MGHEHSEDKDDEGIHLHAAAGDLDNFLEVMQKHPKDVRIGDESKNEDDAKAEVVVKKSTGIVEEQFLENMKNYNNLKDALTSLSSNIDQVANDRSHEVKC